MRGLTARLLVLFLVTVGEGVSILLEQKSTEDYHPKDTVRILQNPRPIHAKPLFLLFPQRFTYENPEMQNLEMTDSVDEYPIPSMTQKRKDDEMELGKRVFLARIGKRQIYAARIG